MPWRLQIVLSVLVLCVSGCQLMGETYINVSATLVSAPVQSKGCKLRIRRATDNNEVDWRHVSGEVFEGFVLPARVDEYFFVIDCKGYSQFISKNYQLGTNVSFNSTVDLGEILLIQSSQ